MVTHSILIKFKNKKQKYNLKSNHINYIIKSKNNNENIGVEILLCSSHKPIHNCTTENP